MNSHVGKEIRAILFDHDDTLVATLKAKIPEHKLIASRYYGKELTDDDIREHWGKPMTTMMGLLYGTDDIDQAIAYNKVHHKDFPKLLHDDTLATLQHLKKIGIKIGVITATIRFSFEHDLQTLGFPKELFDYTQTVENTPYHKPDSRVFQPAIAWLKKEGIKPSEVIYVGDGLQDMKAALGAGFEFIGVETGVTTGKQFKTSGANSIKKLGDLI